MHQLAVGEGDFVHGELLAGAQNGSLRGAPLGLDQLDRRGALVQGMGTQAAAHDIHKDPFRGVNDVLGQVLIFQVSKILDYLPGDSIVCHSIVSLLKS